MALQGLTELADHVFVYEVRGPIVVNSAIIVGDDGVAVVDTGTVESDAQLILEALASVTDKPLRYVINTHHHGDHTFGNWWLLPAVVVGHASCRLRLIGELGAQHREALAGLVPMVREQIQSIPIVAPDLTFQEQVRVHLGNLTLRLDYFGRAHTDNDIAIAVEEPSLSFAGDLIEESGPPITFEAYPQDWGSTLRQLEKVAESRFIPGHGREVDRAFVSFQAQGFEELAVACAAAPTVEAALASIPAASREVLGHHAESAVQRYFVTAR
jgi:glyoxylase-like metal-dependent hydrolase (beta-lactamase superfamily II)